MVVLVKVVMHRVRQCCIAGVLLGAAIAGCHAEESLQRPINSPYPSGEMTGNTFFTAFVRNSPKYFDPAQSYSADETPFTYNIYEPLYGYHYLKRPYQLEPRAAQAIAEPVFKNAKGETLPPNAPADQIAESVYDITIRPAIRFAPSPVFARNADGGYIYFPLAAGELNTKFTLPDFLETGTRELTADDYVYGIKRLASPRVASPIYSLMAEYIIGMPDFSKRLKQWDARLREGLPAGTRDLPWMDLREQKLEGVVALDAHTLRIRIKGRYPQFKYWLAMTFTAPIPWEADRFYSQRGMAEHDLSLNTWPVGTGPFMLVESIRNRRHVLARNPNFWGEPYPCDGEPSDREAGRLLDCGKPTPFIDRAVFTIEKEALPLTGKFLQGYYDVPQLERGEYGVSMRVAAGDSAEKASLYRAHGIQLPTTVEPQNWYMGFNWNDPVVGGGTTPEEQERHRKLRQAISIAFNWEEYIAIFENSQAAPAYGPVPPGVLGSDALPPQGDPYVYDLVDGKPVRKSLADAARLLAEAGYPHGRNAQTGQPLVLHYDSMAGGGVSSQFDWMRRQLAGLGIQLDIRSTDYNRFQDKMRRGVAQLFLWGWKADYPDAENFLFLLYGPNAKAAHGGENAANYENPEFDALFGKMKTLDDGPEKIALIGKMVALVQRDAPWMFGYFPMSGGAYQQWVGNAKPSQMIGNGLQYLKLDPALRAQKVVEWNRPVWWPLWLLAAFLIAAIWPSFAALKRRERQTAFGETVGVRAARAAADAVGAIHTGPPRPSGVDDAGGAKR
jgi:ABC-type transport system substrate-binding protein